MAPRASWEGFSTSRMTSRSRFSLPHPSHQKEMPLPIAGKDKPVAKQATSPARKARSHRAG